MLKIALAATLAFIVFFDVHITLAGECCTKQTPEGTVCGPCKPR